MNRSDLSSIQGGTMWACSAWALLAIFISLLGPTRIVYAASWESRERAARMACLAGDYSKGVATLSQLFVDSGDPNYIYNQGRCFEQNARYPEAMARFQEYLRVGKKLSKMDKAQAEKHIADCQDLLSKQPGQSADTTSRVAAVPLAARSVTPQQPAPPAPPAPDTASAMQLASPISPAVARSPRAGLRTTGIVTAAFGGAALAAGIVLNLKVNRMATDFQTLNGYSDGRESDRQTYETLGWVSYGVGAACLATGAVLFVLGHQTEARGSTSVALVPVFSPGGAEAILQGAF